LEYAKIVAEHIGARHVVVSPDAEYAKSVLPAIVEAVGQPIFPSSAIGCWAVCEAAKHEGIRSVADGTGPDELFGGYVRYALVIEEDRLARIPEFVDYVPMVKRFWGTHAFEHPAARYYDLLRAGGPADSDPLAFVHRQFEGTTGLVAAMTRTDLQLGMRGFLAMTAGCSRGHGLEWRSPLFTDPIISSALSLPDRVKIRNGCGKWVFRQAMRGTVPDRILDRVDKKGWVTPVAGWFGGPLEEWADGLRRSLLNRGIAPRLDPSRGEFDQSVFQDVCLELWLRKFVDQR
jgi:asparagine synthase (glutamine-hydrolysing)